MFSKTIEKKAEALRFHIVNTDRFKMSRLSFNFILPADREKSPLTKLMLAVMMRGCRKYPSVVSINKRLDELYGATVTWRALEVGNRHIFKISCEMLSNRFRFANDSESIADSVGRVIMDILFDPLKDENGLLDLTNFESERKLAIDAIRAKINDQKAYAAEKCKDILFEGSGYGISVDGTIEQLEKITLKDVTDNIDHFLENAVLECYYVGNDNVASIIDLVTDRFSKIDRKNAAISVTEIPFHIDNNDCRMVEENMPVSQGRLNIGCTSGVVMSDKGYYSMSLFNEMFGGASVSKLFMNLREEQSLCYYCYSSYSSATGIIMIGCGIKPENRDKAIEEIQHQLSEMQQGNFTDDEIETAKRTLISGLRQIYDSPSSIEAYKIRRVITGINETVEDSISKVQNNKREDIISSALNIKLKTVYFLSGDCEEGGCDDEEY